MALRPKRHTANRRPELGDEFPIPFVTRKTPTLLVMRMLIIILTVLGLYILLRVIVPVPEEGGINFASFGMFLLFTVVQLGLISYAILRWMKETYEIHKEDIHHNQGILFRKEETYPFNNMQSITCRQSPMGRLYHYGEVRIYIPTLGRDLVFREVPQPHHFIHTIRHIMPYPDKQRFIING